MRSGGSAPARDGDPEAFTGSVVREEVPAHAPASGFSAEERTGLSHAFLSIKCVKKTVTLCRCEFVGTKSEKPF